MADFRGSHLATPARPRRRLRHRTLDHAAGNAPSQAAAATIGSPQRIAAARHRLIDDPGLRLGRHARAKVAAEGLWPNKATGLVELYRKVLA
ncbi:hypothetical protein [Jannaschia faecimaris]|uniref:hypothetical protein n=1 Tax=Jannaschia faecimaris TaxID=1244108 RepID=UPI000B896588|nr:hypothetical protein [Jannaschia faecimaris]